MSVSQDFWTYLAYLPTTFFDFGTLRKSMKYASFASITLSFTMAGVGRVLVDAGNPRNKHTATASRWAYS